MTSLLIGRIAAAVLAGSTFVFLFIHDSWRADNLFLVPDLIMCAALAVAAGLPSAIAGRALTVAFALSAGVFMTSVASYAVDGRLGAPSLAGAVAAAAFAVWLASRPRPTPAR